MANTKSAEKRMRQNEKRRDRNRQHRSRMRTAIKKFRSAVEAGDATQARELLPSTLTIVDASASKGIIHRNAAARTKSRLSKAAAALG
ncbi:MAG: 30S ribosomal protein S20 [Acidobacteriota bacterium]